MSGRWFDDLGQDPTGRSRVQEGDPAGADSRARLAVDELDPLLAKLRERGFDVVDPVGDVVQPGTAAGEEPADGGVLAERAQELDMAVADVEEDGLDPLVADGFAMGDRHPEGPLIERERRIKVLDRNADVIDQPEHLDG